MSTSVVGADINALRAVAFLSYRSVSHVERGPKEIRKIFPIDAGRLPNSFGQEVIIAARDEADSEMLRQFPKTAGILPFPAQGKISQVVARMLCHAGKHFFIRMDETDKASLGKTSKLFRAKTEPFLMNLVGDFVCHADRIEPPGNLLGRVAPAEILVIADGIPETRGIRFQFAIPGNGKVKEDVFCSLFYLLQS